MFFVYNKYWFKNFDLCNNKDKINKEIGKYMNTNYFCGYNVKELKIYLDKFNVYL
jgi:hypothetical protein